VSSGAAPVRLAHAAALIASITVLARIAGFGRTVVYGHTVGGGCVATVYTSANVIPNIVFDVVAGGTLSALVVPILAPAFAEPGRQLASRIVSALLTWTLLVMLVVTVLLAALAAPISHLLLGGQQCAGSLALSGRMLVVFAPQVVFYGLGVVLGGVLQSAERFTWPALAPLLSSVVVIAAYAIYGSLAGDTDNVSGLSRTDELILSVGTTLGVVVLAMCQLPAAMRLGIRIRPTLHFPRHLTGSVRQAAMAGGATLGAQQIATAVMIRLANSGTPVGTAVVVTFAQTVYLLPWAVLAVPIATSVFPRLSAAWTSLDREQASDLAGRTAKVITALAAVGTASLVAASEPIARVMLNPGDSPAHASFGPAIAGFAVGLLGWSLVALLARALYAARRVPLAAGAQVAGWIVAIVADIVLSATAPASDRAVVLAIGNATGVTVAAGLLAWAAWRVGILARVGSFGLDCGRAVLAAAVGALAGWGVSVALGPAATWGSLLIGTAAGLVAIVVSVAILATVDSDLLATARSAVGTRRVLR
jgi:putative peptidoglycan lipid II flippase